MYKHLIYLKKIGVTKTIAFLMLSCAIGIASCKKELLQNNETNGDEITIQNISLRSIAYTEFLNRIDLSKLGTLKEPLTQTGKNKVFQIQTDGTQTLTLELDNDSVKLLKRGDTLSYVIALKPITPRSVSFQNLTVQVVGNKTLTFVSNYLPTKQWIDAWRTKHPIAFEGEVAVKEIILSGSSTAEASSNRAIQTTNICTTYWTYEFIGIQCIGPPDNRHYPGEPGCSLQGREGGPRIEIYAVPHISCETSTGNPGGGTAGGEGDGGGGGATTPNPPGDYNPCNNGPVAVTSTKANQSRTIFGVPPSDCDPSNPPSLPPAPNPEDPGEAYELTVVADSIKLSNRFNCFNSIPDNSSTAYKVTLYTELADKDRPGALLNNNLIPGHTFITLTKTNGNNTVSETFGFYPQSDVKASFQLPVKSMVVDNQNHIYDASLTINVSANQFTAMINIAVTKAQNSYSMTSYNCTNYALDIFNQGLSSALYVPSNVGIVTGFNYGKTPSGVYSVIKNMQTNGVNGASIIRGTGVASTRCN